MFNISCIAMSFSLLQDSKGKSPLAQYLFDNAQTSNCVQVKEEITSYVEQFKTDGT